MAAAKKLVLTYVDSLRTDLLERAVAEERAPTIAALLERGVLVPDCVSSFPSVTPVACSELVTGVGSDAHWISGMNWYHRLERRYVEYDSSLDATRAVGVFRALYDLVYNMNLAHLSPEVDTVFERLDDAGERDHLRPRRDRHQVPHRRGSHHSGPRREEPGVAFEVAGAGLGASPVRRWRYLAAHAPKCGGSTPRRSGG